MTDDTEREPAAASTDSAFGWRSWVLVSMLVVAFVFVPVVLAVLAADPSLVGTLGFGFRDAYLVIPLVPGVLLGLIAVWAAVSGE